MAKILICDDEPGLRAVIKRYALFEGHEATEAGNGAEAVKACQKEVFDIVADTAAGFLMNAAAGFSVCAACIILCALFFIFTRKRYGRIAALSEQIDLILHGRDALDINVFHEGELSILQSEIQKMTVRLREQADALTKDKTFLADSLVDIAHQLRTPMTSLHMLASFLAKPDLDVEQRRPFSHELESLLSRMDWLLSALLKISKIDAGTAVFQRDEISISVLLKKAAQPLEIPLELRGIALRVRCEPSNSITGDLNWTAEALGNILKNCMEHTGQDGTIEIDCTQNAVYTEIAIKDSGAGIAPEDLPHIFKRFYQGKHHKDGSFGVGLALSRMILSAQSATVKAANRSEGGACFTVRFYCA